MSKCKICEAEEDRRLDIEKRLKTGRPCRDLSQDLKKLGFPVTSTQLLNHLSHMDQGDHDPNVSKMVTIMDDTLNISRRLKELEKDLLTRDYTREAVHVRLKMSKMLELIGQKHMIIVDELLDRFGDGLCPYPKDQIRGMQIVFNLLNTLPTYTDKAQLYEIEQISEKARV